MSQQEFVPQSQEEQTLDEHEQYPQQPYYWSTKPDSKASPKDEPMSSYNEPMVQEDNGSDYQQGYMAQDHVTFSNTRKQNPGLNQSQGQTTGPRSQQSWSQSQSQQQQFAPGGNTAGQKYGATPGYQYQYDYHYQYQYPGWRVPSWAQPQQQQQRQGRRGFGGFWLIILALIFLGPMLRFLGIALAIGFSIALPFIVIGLLVIPFIFFRAISRSRRRRRGPPLFWMDR